MSDIDDPTTTGGITRKGLLRNLAAAGGALALAGGPVRALGAAAAAGRTNIAGMNIVLFITDQERHIQHFPAGWASKNLPAQTELARHGLTFQHATTNAAMCSPARSTLMTGYFPAQHGVKYTLEEDMPAATYPQVELPTPATMANLATVMSAAGYNVIYKGKWHCSKPAGATWSPADLEAYGFSRWDPQDAGADQSLSQMGGGIAQNDARFMSSTSNTTDGSDGNEGALEFLTKYAAAEQPFCLIVSLVNPHDVLAYPKNFGSAGYTGTWLTGDIGLPATVDENLSTKPRAQGEFLALSTALGRLRNAQMKRNYLNFYGNLMRASDNYLADIVAALKSVRTSHGSVFDNTLIIKTSDHGEMGLAHGGLRQKNFNMYEETLRVPLMYSNPKLFPKPRVSQALVSHVDLLPTLASLVDAPGAARSAWQGRDYSKIVLSAAAKPVQDYVVFTYDDYQSGQSSGPYVQPPQHIVAIRETRWKIARYYDPSGRHAPEFEMYDLLDDPLERINLANPHHRRTPAQQRQLVRLLRKLETVEATRLAPLPSTVEWAPT